MRLLSFDSATFSPDLRELVSSEPVAIDEIVFLIDRRSLRALLDSIRETHEELRDGDFRSRTGIEAEQANELWNPIAEVYEASADVFAVASATSNLLQVGIRKVVTEIGSSGDPDSLLTGDPLPAGALVFAASREEIAAHIEMCSATMEVLDDWDYSIRMGFTREEVQAIIEELRQLI